MGLTATLGLYFRAKKCAGIDAHFLFVGVSLDNVGAVVRIS